MMAYMDRARFELIIVDLIAMSTHKALIKHGVTQYAFYKYLRTCPSASQDYACAREARSEFFADEIIEIADTEVDAQKARNQIDARKWYTSKMAPQKYGERVDINLNSPIGIREALEEARARVLHGRFAQSALPAQVVDITQQTAQNTPDALSGDIDDLLS